VLKLLLKEIVVPAKSSRFLFIVAPLLAIVPAFATWAVIPLSPSSSSPTSMPACCTCWR
jgi:NADH-quinone oxidoreductase subunit H